MLAEDVVSHLNISNTRVEHGGLYSCIARNILGSVQHSALLNVHGNTSTFFSFSLCRKFTTESTVKIDDNYDVHCEKVRRYRVR